MTLQEHIDAVHAAWAKENPGQEILIAYVAIDKILLEDSEAHDALLRIVPSEMAYVAERAIKERLAR